jgi:4,5:9,10-diseco-3-hydroxy-5,9,17-trioxoandrosta-1(10),2-diene-4-oate hydrolase
MALIVIAVPPSSTSVGVPRRPVAGSISLSGTTLSARARALLRVLAMGDSLDFDATSRWWKGRYDLHYHEAGDGPVLILLHGSGPGVSGWSNFRGNLPVFAERFRTIIPDMPGFGLSPFVPIDRFYSRVAADAVRDLMNGLGIERAHLLGNSFGGSVCGYFALESPERADKLVLMGPGGFATTLFGPDLSEGAKRLREFMANPTRDGMVAWVDCMVEEKSVVDDRLIDERMDNALQPGVMDAARAILASFRDPRFADDLPLWAQAARLTHPTLVTWGRDDRMLPYESGVFAFRRMPNAEMHVFSRCGHWAQVERKADFERVVTEFLTRPQVDDR